MTSLPTIRGQLLLFGEAVIVVRHHRQSMRLMQTIDEVLTIRPEQCVLVQQRQNHPDYRRLILTTPVEAQRIWQEPGPWQQDIDAWDEAYLAVSAAIKDMAMPDEARDHLDEIHALYRDVLAERPHPDNPYVNALWVGVQFEG